MNRSASLNTTKNRANAVNRSAETKKPKMIDPKDSSTVFVDVTAYNSKIYYVQGECRHTRSTSRYRQGDHPGCHQLRRGLTPTADHKDVVLYRQPKKGGLATSFAHRYRSDHDGGRPFDQLPALAR